MGFYRQDHVQVARCATTCADLTFTRDAHINAIVHTGRYIDDNAPVVTHTALTTTFLARSRNDTAFTSTAFTHRDIDKLPEDGLLYTPNLARSLTGRTTCR